MRLFKELDSYFNFYIFIKVLFPIILGCSTLKINKMDISLYSIILLFIGIIVFWFKQKPKLFIPSIKPIKRITSLLILSLFLSFTFILLLNKFGIFNREKFYINNSFNILMFLLITPIFQGFYYRKMLLAPLSKIYGKNISILIMIAFFILFENKFITIISFSLIGFSIILGYLYLENISIITTIIVHILYNILMIIFIKYIYFFKIPINTLFILAGSLIFLLISKLKNIKN